MALAGSVYGSFSGISNTRVRLLITWTASQNISANTSTITANLFIQSVSAYYGQGTCANTRIVINSRGYNFGDTAFNISAYETELLRTKVVTVNHNVDGTLTCGLGATGSTDISWGSFNFSENITLNTIPRGASITSSASFTAGNSIPVTFSNPASGYLKVRMFVHDGTDYEPYIKDQNMGVVSSGTVTFTTAQINAIYTQLGSATSRGCLLRVGTYSDSGYSVQIGDYADVYGTCTQPARAILSGNADLTIGNNKVTAFSNTNSKYVRLEYWINGNAGWYKVRNEEVGTGTGYTFTMTSTHNNNMYSRMPNVTSASALVRAYTYQNSDYSTQIRAYHDIAGTVSVNQTTNKPTFTTFTVSNLDKTIDNDDKYSNTLISSSTSTLLGADTKMIKGHSKLRAVVTSANKMVALNSATANKYRFTSGTKYKEENYSSDSTVNLDIDNAENSTVSVTAYDSRSLTTTVNDSATITNNAEYEAVSLWGMTLERANGVDSETTLAFSGSYWNEYFGGGTAGVENAVVGHYRYKETTESWGAQSWTAITGDITDTDGALSYEEEINGDLGATGFDTEKSFDIEVRVYDKLTNVIIEKTLSVGIPVMDITADGVALGDRYNETSGGTLQILGKNILDIMYPVGSIYTNYNVSTNPATLMGFGTWSAVAEGRMLVGKESSGTFDTATATGGSETQSLDAGDIPSHRHGMANHRHTFSGTTGNPSANHQHAQYVSANAGTSASRLDFNSDTQSSIYGQGCHTDTVSSWHTHTVSGNTGYYGTGAYTGYYGSGNSFSILPPYLVVYLWRRTA